MMRPEALPPYVLIVAPECATKVVDYSDRATAVLWGDGGAAAVLQIYHADLVPPFCLVAAASFFENY